MYTPKQLNRYADLVAKGYSRGQAAGEVLGINGPKARAAGARFAKHPIVIQRVAELMAVQVVEEPKRSDEGYQGVTREWVIRTLQRNIEEARQNQQFSVVNKATELLARITRIYTDKQVVYDFPTDISQCSEEELLALQNLALTLMYGEDEAKKRSELRRLELEAGLIIEAEPQEPEW